MTTYIALLRGINVGGKNKVAMADLKRALEDLGLEAVKTYIQSGNIVFRSDKTESALKAEIEKAVKNLGVSAAAVVRTASELKGLIAACPFSAEEIEAAQKANLEGESLYACLLDEPLAEKSAEKLMALATAQDAFVINGREVYLLLSRSIRHSKAAALLMKPDAAATVRNWKTLTKLLELADL